MQPATNPSLSGQGGHPPRRARTRSPPTKRHRTNLPNAIAHPSIRPSPPSPPSQSISQSCSPSPTPRSPSSSPPTQGIAQSSAKWFRKPSVVWYRGNDLRVEDHPALLAAAQRGGPVVPFFVWDPLDGFGDGFGHVKQWWLRESLRLLHADLRRLGVKLYTRTGRSTDQLRAFLEETGADAVFWNRCYEPDLLKRDEELRAQLAHEGLTAESFKAELLVEPWELSNTDVSPCFPTFHTYMRAWMTVPPPPQPFPCPSRLLPINRNVKSTGIDSLEFDIPPNIEQSMSKVWKPGSTQAKLQLDKFLHEVFPAFGEERCRRHFEGTSRLSPHIRFGELSPRRMYHSTRLRVSRWDQAAIHSYSVQPTILSRRSSTKRPRAGRVTSHNSQRTDDEAVNSDSVCQEKICEREERGELQRGNAHKGMDEKQAPLQTTPDRLGASNDSEKRNEATKDGKTSTLHRKPSLPHISLSARAFLKNLCLRDFSYHILFHNPDFNSSPLIPEFNSFPWAEDNGSFDSWKNGVTGYPIVDAAMRELRETGWIHNGMRFLLACFLTKYLLLPWSRGLKAFYGLLVDGDHSSNALGWQWTAGSNTDAFPFSCLVNPVKVAYRHDPTGSYVRRWIPELAKLPTEYIHEPWKAPKELLTQHGIDIGSTYPKRVVLMAEARSRASKAMSVMKQIFSGSTIRRSVFGSREDDVVHDWPESQPEVLRMEVLRMDGAQSLTGKSGLLASLWALIPCDEPSTYLSSSSSGSDALIAMDTASLVEGALAVPLDEQHESIEHALITAHEQSTSDPTLSTVGVLQEGPREIDGPSFPPDTDCEGRPELRENAGATGVDMQHLEEPLKYTSAGMSTFSDQEKHGTRERAGPSTSMRQGDAVAGSVRANQELHPQQLHSTTTRYAAASHATNFASVATQYSHPSQPHIQQQLQQLQQFQQLEALRMQQQQTLGHLQQPSCTPSSQAQPSERQQLQRSGETQPQGSHQHSRRPHPRIPQSQSQPLMLQSSQAQGHQPAVPSGQHTQASQRQQHVHQTHSHNVMDNVYNPSMQNSNIHATALTEVPITGTPVMMGPVSSSADPSNVHTFGTADPSSALYSHHLGMNQFYGFQPVLPVMNTSHINGTERFETLGVSAATNSQKLTVPGMMPLGYGMYGAGTFDPNVISNAFTPNGNSYGTGPAIPQSQGHLSQQQNPYGLPTHPMYCPPPSGSDIPRTQACTGGNVPHQAQPASFIHNRSGVEGAGIHRNQVSSPPNMAAHSTGEREVPVRISAEAVPQRSKHNTDGTLSAEDQTSRARVSTAPVISSTRSPRAAGSATSVGRAQPSRATTKAGMKSRHASRNRRGSRGGGSASRQGADIRGQARVRGRGGDVASHGKRARSVDKGQATTLKSRQEMLTSVLESEEHEYHAFAQYLSVTYELTGNTDRQTSRDYVRLCNLKDDYHRQYPAEKDKLKIYSMKRFFSQFLNLEVTGEWDRHNHGGVRGPYVYGIRARTQAESSASAPKS